MKGGLAAIALVISLPCSTAREDVLLSAFAGDAIYRCDGTAATPLSSSGLMDGPTALAYNAAGNVLVLNEFSKNVLEFNGSTGAYVGTLISTSAILSAGITDPGDMEVGADG